jgi:hypothetical protein
MGEREMLKFVVRQWDNGNYVIFMLAAFLAGMTLIASVSS